MTWISAESRGWAGIFTGPVLFLCALQAHLTYAWTACSSRNLTVVHAVAVATMLLTAWTAWMAHGVSQEHDGEEEEEDKVGFLSHLGFYTAAFFVLADLALWLPAFLNWSCQ